MATAKSTFQAKSITLVMSEREATDLLMVIAHNSTQSDFDTFGVYEALVEELGYPERDQGVQVKVIDGEVLKNSPIIQYDRKD